MVLVAGWYWFLLDSEDHFVGLYLMIVCVVGASVCTGFTVYNDFDVVRVDVEFAVDQMVWAVVDGKFSLEGVWLFFVEECLECGKVAGDICDNFIVFSILEILMFVSGDITGAANDV